MIVRDAFAANVVTSPATNGQERTLDIDLDVLGSNSCEIDFHDPTITGAVDIGGGAPQTTRRPPMAIVANHAEVAFKRLARHRNSTPFL